MINAEYVGVREVTGPFVIVEGARDVSYGEVVQVRDTTGSLRRGRVVMVNEDACVVQVFSGTQDLVPADTRVRFLGKFLEFGVSPQILGRVFNGLGEPRDGCGPVYGGSPRNVNGSPINPMARQYPRDFIHTGISVVDMLTTLIRGQKLPIFSGNGLPHNRLAVQIALQSRLVGAENFAVVFAGVGIKHDDAEFFQRSLIEGGTVGNIVMFLNLADDPVIERIATPRFALTAAEYLAFEQGMHVLIILTDMTNYCEALRELSVARGEVPSRKGYPAYMYSDLASLYERAGILADRKGSLTQLPILTMPNDDITHPIPDLTGFITEGQIVLSRSLDARGVYPPVDVLMSLSRLMKDSIGEGYTRGDHPSVASQVFASYSRVQEIKALASIVGEDELGKTDRACLEFGRQFERQFITQGPEENRTIEQSLDLCWQLLSILPETELTRVSQEEIKEHMKKK
jgi:V/A-type H+-transporting ATPase subunit B